MVDEPDELLEASLASLASLAERIQVACLRQGLRLAAAESCTGGLVGHLLTDVPGSSAYFRGSIVAYADEAKEGLLGVPRELLSAHGAVSAQVARAMAMGARARFDADLGVGVTGIAGPGGGSEAKPVGLTYVAVADSRGAEVRRHVWSGGRSSNKEASARASLQIVLSRVEGSAQAAGSEEVQADPQASPGSGPPVEGQ